MLKAPRKTTEELRAAIARRAIVDEYGDLVAYMRPHKSAAARLLDLAKTIRAWYANEAASQSFTAHGDHYDALIGDKGNETRIEDMQAVYDAMGHEKFLAQCSMTLAALAVAGLDPAAFTVKEQTGSRSLTVTELPE